MNNWDWLLLLVVSFHAVCTPFTKVEESFNIQAIHDLLYHGLDLEQYDHHIFPGVVPRSFLAPILVSILAFPIVSVLNLLALPKVSALIAVRLCIGFLSVCAFSSFREALEQKYGTNVGKWFIFITAIQFHLPFYMSRSLPNTFALMLCTYALAQWVRGSNILFLIVSVFTTAVFRCELVLLFAPLLLVELAKKRLNFFRGLFVGFVTLVFSILLSTAVDSYFWSRLCWPEGEVFYFNVILNRSNEWGTSPFHWYFTAALPKMLSGCLLLLLPSQVLSPSAKRFLTPAFFFVGMYSFLPHKEVRFIFYAIPLMNAALACGCVHLTSLLSKNSQNGGFMPRLRSIVILSIFIVAFASTALTTLIATRASNLNYPSAHALAYLHHHVSRSSTSSSSSSLPSHLVHIDPHAAMNGISLFCERQDSQWKYDKAENLTDFSQYDFLVNGKPNVTGFELIHSQKGFSHLNFRQMISVITRREFDQLPSIDLFERSDSVFVHAKLPSSSI